MTPPKPSKETLDCGQRTTAIHAGEPVPRIGDAIAMPIFQSSTYLLGEPETFDDIRYIRLNNTPNHTMLSRKLAALEKAESALVTPSGTAAIAAALLTHLSSGDHALVPQRIYGGTHKIFDRLSASHGIDVSFVDFEDSCELKKALTPRTKLMYVEPLVNPLLQVVPLDSLVAFAREHKIFTVVDNTLLSPHNFRPLEMGFDMVIHSASKYLNGHNDIVAGVVAGKNERVTDVRKTLNLFGMCLDPHACFLLQRGIKTLSLRVEAHNQTTLALAKALSAMPAVRQVHYTGLRSDPGHTRASRWFDGHGGVLSFRLRGGVKAAEAVLSGLHYAHVAPSLGGLETLVSRPVTTSHAGLTKALRDQMNVGDDLVRVAVGLEDKEDLIADFEQAIQQI